MNARTPPAPSVDFAYDEVPDLHDILDQLRARGPVVRVQYLGQPAWLILGFAELKQAFADEIHFASAAAYRIHSEPAMGKTLQTMSGEHHRVNRALVSRPFLPRQIREATGSLLQSQAQLLLDKIAGLDELDLVPAFSRPYPFSIITRLLGIPVADDVRFLEWASKLIDFPWDPAGALRVKQEFDDYVIPLIEQRRQAPGEDVISLLATAELDQQQLSNEEILSFCRLLFPAGSDTTYKNLGSLLYAILGDPALREQALGSDDERAAIVQEGLRWNAPTALLPRMCSADTELGGAAIMQGEWVLFGITAANHDPAVFPEPRQFLPQRRNRNLAFGNGEHFCLGSHLARAELEAAIKLIFKRFPQMQLLPHKPVSIIHAVLRGPRDLWVCPGPRV